MTYFHPHSIPVFLAIVFLTTISCSTSNNGVTRSHASSDEGDLFSETHIDFAKWRRTPACCTASGGKKIAIASGGSESSKCGMKIHDQGGNLVDAAIATLYCLSVERPQSAGLGGGGFFTLHLAAKNGKPAVNQYYDFRETAPAKATKDMFVGKDGKVDETKSLEGGLAIATPGFVAGTFDVHRDYGKLPWKAVLKPAIDLANEGFTVYPALEERIESEKENLNRNDYAKKLLFIDGKGLKAFDSKKLKQPELAQTISKIAIGGPEVFYKGAIATAIVKHVKSIGGILSEEDLAHYKVVKTTPLRGTYKNFTFYTAPPPSAGGVQFIQMLKVLNGFDLAKISQRPSDYIHLISETMKRSYADRAGYIGDPKFSLFPYRQLLTDAYTDKVRASVRKAVETRKATPPGDVKPGMYLAKENREAPNTTHASLMDAEGNAIATTITINTFFGSGVVTPGTGIFLNNEMDDFSKQDGAKNYFGLPGGSANKIEAGKRPVSSMTPTIFLEKGKPVLALGAAGGSRIVSHTFQVALNDLVLWKKNLRNAVFAPRLHQQWSSEGAELELSDGGFSTATRSALTTMGHQLPKKPVTWRALVQAVQRDNDGFTAVIDPFDDGGALVK